MKDTRAVTDSLNTKLSVMTFDLLTLILHFPEESVETSLEVLDAIITNDLTKNILARALGDLGHKDLKLKVSRILCQEKG